MDNEELDFEWTPRLIFRTVTMIMVILHLTSYLFIPHTADYRGVLLGVWGYIIAACALVLWGTKQTLPVEKRQAAWTYPWLVFGWLFVGTAWLFII